MHKEGSGAKVFAQTHRENRGREAHDAVAAGVRAQRPTPQCNARGTAYDVARDEALLRVLASTGC